MNDIVKILERKSVGSVPLTKTPRPKLDYLNIEELKNNILLWKDEKEIYKVTLLLDDFNKIMDLLVIDKQTHIKRIEQIDKIPIVHKKIIALF